MPDDFEGDWVIYDATANVPYGDLDELAEALEVESEEIEQVVDSLPVAKVKSKSIKPRRFNSMNNAGFEVYVVHDATAKHGAFAIRCNAVSDLDTDEVRTGVTLSELTKEAVGIAREMQAYSDGE
jgi:hypothetical protein